MKSSGRELGTSFLHLWYKHNTSQYFHKGKVRLINVLKNQLKSMEKFLHLEIYFLLKDLHSVAETSMFQSKFGKDDLDKTSPSVCMSVKAVASKLLSER